MTDRLPEIKTWLTNSCTLTELGASYVQWLIEEVERLRQRLLSAAGDDLCRLTQEEIKELSSGVVQIPPKEEFLASCERFHAQIASESGVMPNCLTLAQLIAENEQLRTEVEWLRTIHTDEWLRQLTEAIKKHPAVQATIDDAERWLHVREHPYCLQCLDSCGEYMGLWSGDEADAAVDAARRAIKPPV